MDYRLPKLGHVGRQNGNKWNIHRGVYIGRPIHHHGGKDSYLHTPEK